MLDLHADALTVTVSHDDALGVDVPRARLPLDEPLVDGVGHELADTRMLRVTELDAHDDRERVGVTLLHVVGVLLVLAVSVPRTRSDGEALCVTLTRADDVPVPRGVTETE